ncbi:acetolactate synthase small subunit [Lewinellaceae bacterium SD302]|nr:acetolactate synthase small subunit [Lewinellaceae bacterium SD302]
MEQKSNKERLYTLVVFSENLMGILARIVTIITRRHINIESLNTSVSSMQGIHRYTIVVRLSEERIRKLTAQIDKQVDVLKTFYYTNDEVVYQEIALYKIPAKTFYEGNTTESLVRKHNARVLTIEPEYIVIEKTGHYNETEALLEDLRPFGVYEFVRSGRVVIVKEMERLNNYLASIEAGEVGN